jgi:hypothetical protein
MRRNTCLFMFLNSVRARRSDVYGFHIWCNDFGIRLGPADVRKFSYVWCLVHFNICKRCEILTAVVMKSSFFGDITPCIPLEVSIRFRGILRLHLQSLKISSARNQLLPDSCWFPVWLILRSWRWGWHVTSKRISPRYTPEDNIFNFSMWFCVPQYAYKLFLVVFNFIQLQCGSELKQCLNK